MQKSSKRKTLFFNQITIEKKKWKEKKTGTKKKSDEKKQTLYNK